MRTLLALFFLTAMACLADDIHQKAVEESTLRAIERWPDVEKDGTPLFEAITKRIEQLQISSPGFFDMDGWPEILAAVEAARLGVTPASQSVLTPSMREEAERAERRAAANQRNTERAAAVTAARREARAEAESAAVVPNSDIQQEQIQQIERQQKKLRDQQIDMQREQERMARKQREQMNLN